MDTEEQQLFISFMKKGKGKKESLESRAETDIRIIQYSSTVLGIMDIWVFLAKEFTQKPASQLHPGTLTALVRYNQAQKCLQYDPNI